MKTTKTQGARRPSAKATQRATSPHKKSASTGKTRPRAKTPAEGPRGSCLSSEEIAQLAMEAPFLGDRADHLTQCSHCSAALQVAMEQLRDARYERVPPAQRFGYRPWWKQHRWWGALAFAVMALGVAIVLPPPASDAPFTLKGKAQVYATVLRQGRYAIDDAPLAKLAPLQADDRVRLRIENGAQRHVRIESQEPFGWQVLMESTVPADGWLPDAFEMSAAPHSQLRITLCADLQQPASCESQTYPL